MGRCIVSVLDNEGERRYLEWSTVVDAPVTYGMTLDEFVTYYRDRYGLESLRDLPRRLEQAIVHGTSSHYHKSLEQLIEGNHAGDEEPLTLAEIIDTYCHPIKWTATPTIPGFYFVMERGLRRENDTLSCEELKPDADGLLHFVYEGMRIYPNQSPTLYWGPIDTPPPLPRKDMITREQKGEPQ